MAYLTKKVGKLKRKLNMAKSKEITKKHACDSLDSDSNSDYITNPKKTGIELKE
jgi:hypothetical protein